jgi:hypothetical protein
MKLSEIEQLKLQNIDLKMQILKKNMMEITDKVNMLQLDGNLIIQKFCDDNKIDIKKTSIDLETGEVIILEDKKEV